MPMRSSWLHTGIMALALFVGTLFVTAILDSLCSLIIRTFRIRTAQLDDSPISRLWKAGAIRLLMRTRFPLQWPSFR